LKYYLLFNQKVRSDIELPEAVEIEKADDIDVFIELGKPPEWVFEKVRSGYIDHIEEKIMWFYLKNIALFFVENGNHIIIYRESEDISELAIRSYLTGSAMALALIQKGYLPIHGATIEYGGKGIIISGESGAGKSTVTMELLNQGCKFVSDDLSAVQFMDGDIKVLPGFPQQKLCRDVVERFSINIDELIYIDEERDKFARILDKGYVTDPILITCMIVISASMEAEKVECIEVIGGEKLHLLMNNIYRGLVYERLNNDAKRFHMFVQVAATIPIYIIKRPEEGYWVPEIIQCLKKQVSDLELGHTF
jgi:hypothetical protein